MDEPETEEDCNRTYMNRESFGDITFIVEEKHIIAEKWKLIFSPKYKAQFYGEFADAKLKSIEIKDISAAAFEEFLQFFYFGNAPLTHKNIEDVLTLAQSSLVEAYFDGCIEFLSDSLSVDNLCQTYRLATKYNHSVLIERCEREVSLFSDKIFSLNDFLSCTPPTLFNILQITAFNCKEVVVFEACILWAKRRCIEEQRNPDDVENLRATLTGYDLPGKMLHQIRFGTMSIEEYMQCYKNYKQLFTEGERDEILFAIGKVNSSAPKLFNNDPRYSPYTEWNEENSIECSRILTKTDANNGHYGYNRTIFNCDRKIILGGFYLSGLRCFGQKPFPDTKHATVTILIIQKDNYLDLDGTILYNSIENITFTESETLIKLWRPITLRPIFFYEIKLHISDFFETIFFQQYQFETKVEIENKLVPEERINIIFKELLTKRINSNTVHMGIVTRLRLNFCKKEDKLK